MRVLLLLPLLGACGNGETTAPRTVHEEVLVSTHPLEYVARRIAGDAVPVVNPLPEGQDPSHWAPARETLTRYQRARVTLLNGVGYEAWVGGVSLPGSRVVDTSRGLPEGRLVPIETVTHSHGLDGEHSHAAVAGLLWLDPVLLAHQARRAHAAMVRAWPEHADRFDAGLAGLEADLSSLHKDLVATLGSARVLAADPGYAYLGEQVEGFDLDPVNPSGGALERLETALASDPARVLLWSRAPSDEVRARLQEHLGLESVVFGLAANPGEGDYLSIMRGNIDRLRAALE